MIFFGAQLRQAREEKGWTIDYVSFQSKIRPLIIESLEEDHYSIFSSQSYAKSFLRKYGEILGLNLDEQIDQFEIEGLDDRVFTMQDGIGETLETTEFSRKSRRFRKADTGTGSPVFLVGSVVVLISTLATFYYLGSQANVAEAGAREILEDFENQPAPFSREREATERLLSGKTPVAKVEPSLTEPRPFASTNYQGKSLPFNQLSPVADFDEIAKPTLETFQIPEELKQEKPEIQAAPATPRETDLNPLLE